MGRKEMKVDDKKNKISITIDSNIDNQLDELSINKSKLINWLVKEYFNNLNK